MNDHRRKESHKQFVTRHAAQAIKVHGQVTNNNRSIGKAGKETTGHQ